MFELNKDDKPVGVLDVNKCKISGDETTCTVVTVLGQPACLTRDGDNLNITCAVTPANTVTLVSEPKHVLCVSKDIVELECDTHVLHFYYAPTALIWFLAPGKNVSLIRENPLTVITPEETRGPEEVKIPNKAEDVLDAILKCDNMVEVKGLVQGFRLLNQ